MTARRLCRFVLLALAPAALSACGLHPLYGKLDNAPGVGSTLTTIYVEQIPDRVGYELRNDLLDLFNATGQGDNAAYRLKISLTEKEEGVVVQTDTSITRYNYTLAAHYDLTTKDGDTALKSGDVTALDAYNVAAAPYLYATVTAENDAKDRAATEIAERIRTQLAVYLRAQATAKKS